MGYYTNYHLTVKNDIESLPIEFYRTINGCSLLGKSTRKEILAALQNPLGRKKRFTDEMLTDYLSKANIFGVKFVNENKTAHDNDVILVLNADELIRRSNESLSLKDQITKELADIVGYDNLFEEAIKWYDWKEHCTQVSKKYPNVLFWIDGSGEEQGDNWRCFFRNGKLEEYRQGVWVPPTQPVLI